MRKPEYTTDGQWRIVSVPNSLWRLQQFGQRKGTNAKRATKHEPAVPHDDPWQDHSPAVSYGAARELLAAKQPQQAKKGVLA